LGTNTNGQDETRGSNDPLVRLANLRSNRLSVTMGVATGNKIVSTHFDLPDTIEPGPSILEVVANGIPSRSVTVVVQ
jgi:hypothetical protein